jgi:Uma2 family endonuclease
MDDFFSQTEGMFAEWVDGEVLYLSVSEPHQNRVDFLAALMRHFVEEYDSGVVRTAPYSMKLPNQPIVREPDIMFIASENQNRITRNYLDGPADIAIEVISPESRTRDRREKLFEYAQGGIREYWLIDYERRRAEFNRLNDDGTYDLVFIGADGVFRSEVLAGFWLEVSWLWQEPLPKLKTVLQTWGLI